MIFLLPRRLSDSKPKTTKTAITKAKKTSVETKKVKD